MYFCSVQPILSWISSMSRGLKFALFSKITKFSICSPLKISANSSPKTLENILRLDKHCQYASRSLQHNEKFYDFSLKSLNFKNARHPQKRKIYAKQKANHHRKNFQRARKARNFRGQNHRKRYDGNIQFGGD